MTHPAVQGRTAEFPPDQPLMRRARFGAPKDIVKDKDREKELAHFETQCVQFHFLLPGTDSLLVVPIQIDRDVPTRDDRPFKSSGLPFRAFPLGIVVQDFQSCCSKAKAAGA